MDKTNDSVVQRLKDRLSIMGIKNKTLLFVSLVIVISLAVLIYFFVSVFNTKSEKDNIKYSKEILNNVITNLDDYIDQISAVANSTNYEYYLQNYLINQKGSDSEFTGLTSSRSMKDYEMSSKLFGSTINSRTDVSSIMVFGEKNLLLYKTIYSYLYVITDYTKQAWYQNALQNPRQPIVTGPLKHDFLIGNTEKTISLSRVISSYEDGSFLGIILIDLNLNEISKICNSTYSGTEGNLCLVNAEGELIYEQNRTGNDTITLENSDNLKIVNENLQANKTKDFFVTLGQEKYQVVYSHMEKTDWNILSITPYSALTKSMYEILIFIVVVVAVLCSVIILVLNSILTNVIKPIIILKEHMDLADAGNLHARVDTKLKDETGMLAKSFNNMLERIENLMEQVVTEQEDKRKYELQALQAQINPHFLYNTLDSIIWMAEAKNPGIVPMTEALAKLFRISLNKGNEFIKVEDELEHVRNYLVIQNMRYINKFDYDITIEEQVRKCKTIKLIIQPIVENSIYHGIKKKKERGIIQILACKRKSNLVFVISDNGNGMNEKLCKDILLKDTAFANSSGSGIGVKNVNERIKLYFGEDYGITYSSILGQGTIATITLPLLGEEEEERD